MSKRPYADGRCLEAAIFDLDGVLVDTARLHFEAWRRLASELGFAFSEEQNERLKGVSREESLAILLEADGIELAQDVRGPLLAKKNRWYVESLSRLSERDLLPRAMDCLMKLAALDVPMALASASRNARTVLAKTGIESIFQVVVDGTSGRKAKPDPDMFLFAAAELGKTPQSCVVFEDSAVGIDAAHAARMYAVGVGQKVAFVHPDIVVPNLAHCDLDLLFADQRTATRLAC